MDTLSNAIAIGSVLGALLFLTYQALVGQYRHTPTGWVCRRCNTWQTDDYGCDYCARHETESPRRTQ
jgi:hypothetical protein